MADQGDQVDDRARSVALPSDDGEEVIAQQNVGPGGEDGSGEWPSPRNEPAGPAPGTTPEGAQAASRRAQAPFRAPSARSASQADQQQDATTSGDRGPARGDERAESFEPALRADPVAGGSQSAPHEDDEVDTSPG